MAAATAVAIAPAALAQNVISVPPPARPSVALPNAVPPAEPEAVPLYAGSVSAIINIDADGKVAGCSVTGEGGLMETVKDRCGMAMLPGGLDDLPDMPGPMDMQVSLAQAFDAETPQLMPIEPGFSVFMTMSTNAALDPDGAITACTMQMSMPIIPGMTDMDVPCDPAQLNGKMRFELAEGQAEYPGVVHMEIRMATNPSFEQMMEQGKIPK
ncbi:hypothetical protein [Sphingosinithalassobacter portus]|uniref:hypothetical protein n=1 Tax=Stakelama portus TaxID=2676234 RepID=UPI0011AB4229|nr:hypothetical protein [Sphingosinithalassobacter portus]